MCLFVCVFYSLVAIVRRDDAREIFDLRGSSGIINKHHLDFDRCGYSLGIPGFDTESPKKGMNTYGYVLSMLY